MSIWAHRKGQDAEKQALRWLRKRGLRWEHSNYRCKAGEIDLIMRDGDTLVFVEVRYRSHMEFGSAAESVTPRKQQRLRKAALHYLQTRAKMPPCRFDIIGIDAQNQVEWIKNAF